MALTPIRVILSGGDRRSIGRADAVAQEVVEHPALLPELMDALLDRNDVVQMRGADAIEKITRTHAGLLDGYEARLLDLLADMLQQEVRWHLFQLLPRLALTHHQKRTLFELGVDALRDKSRIVAADALSALFSLSIDDYPMRDRALAAARTLLTGAPSIAARARKLLASSGNTQAGT